MINFDFEKECYGCGLCAKICPNNAIIMKENANGFLNPSIDESKCIQCGLCDNNCIKLNKNLKKEEYKEKCYAVQQKDIEDIKKSTSGGIGNSIAKNFIKKVNGFVCGCTWNQKIETEHFLTNKLDEIEKFRGSKYVQSKISKELLNNIECELNNNNKIVFLGTPCQIYSIKAMFDSPNLYTVAIICEGVPSRRIWREYKESLEKKYNSPLISVNYKDKSNCGWERPDVIYTFENRKKEKNLSYNIDMYVSSFVDGLIMNECCYKCEFKNENILADIIIGDFWKLPKEYFSATRKLGVSAVMVKTLKGEQLLEMCLEDLNIIKTQKENIITGNPNLIKPIMKHQYRDKLFENIDNINVKENLKKYNVKLKTFRKKIIKILYKLGLAKYIK